MKNILIRGFLLILSFLIISHFLFSSPQENARITAEWIFSDECHHITDMPRFLWLSDGTAILYDTGIPEEDRTFERLNPRKGKRVTVLDQEKALNGLKSLLGDKDSPKFLAWPLSFDSKGQQAVYSIMGDLFLLDFTESKFARVTETEAEEESISFSPDGKMLGFVRENDLYLYDIAKKNEKRITDNGSETIINGGASWGHWSVFGQRSLGYSWSGDSKSLVFLQSDLSPLSIMYYTDHRPIVPRVIKQRYAKAGQENPIVRLGIVEIDNPNTKWIDLGNLTFEFFTRVKWLPDSERFSVQTINRRRDRLNLFYVDRSTGKVTHILEEVDEGWVNIHDNLHFLKDGKHFIWVSERSGYAHIYRYTMDGRLVNQVTKGDWAIREAGYHDPGPGRAIVGIDEKEGWIYFTSIKKSSIEHHLYRIGFDGTGMKRLTQKDGLNSITFSPDAKYFFNQYSNKRTPPSLSLYNNDGEPVMVLTEPRQEILEKFDMQYPEFFKIPTSDGFPMPAELLKPKDFDPTKKYPLIFHVYQGPSQPEVANAWSRDIYYDQILLNHGYLVARVDNRSATGISKKLENLLWTEHRQMESIGELLDLLDAVKWFKAQPYVDPDRVGLWGWSGGGVSPYWQ